MSHDDYSSGTKNFGSGNSISIIICLWLWAASYVTGFGETRHLRTKINIYKCVIQSVISRERLKPHAYNLLQIYSYLIAIRLPTPQCTAICFCRHFRLVFINTTSTHAGAEVGEWWVATKWQVTVKFSNFLGELA